MGSLYKYITCKNNLPIKQKTGKIIIKLQRKRKMEKKEKIQITECKAFGEFFENLTPGSIHEVLTAPEGKRTEGGVWVMGVGEPVFVLDGEYKRVYNS